MAIPQRARDIMTRNVLSVSSEWSIEELARFLTDHAISGAPVIDDAGKLVGVVSLTDIARTTGNLQVQLAAHGTFYQEELTLGADEIGAMLVQATSGQTVAEIMTGLVFDVAPETPVTQLAQTMVRGRIHRVFVVDEGAVVGVVSALDILALVGEL